MARNARNDRVIRVDKQTYAIVASVAVELECSLAQAARAIAQHIKSHPHEFRQAKSDDDKDWFES